MSDEKERKLKVGVFFGGPSSEKEVSLESGRHIYNSLDRDKYEVIPIFVDAKVKFWEIPEHLIWMNATSDIEKELKTAKEIPYSTLKSSIDFAFLGLHGKYVEDGALQGLLESLGVPYNGPRVLGAAIGMDKIFQKKVLESAGLNYPKHIVVTKTDLKLLRKIETKVGEELGYPCIVKPSKEGCSTGLARVKKKEDLKAALEEALKWDTKVLIEEFMNVMEVTCTVLGNDKPYALPPTETPCMGDFLTLEEKFLPGDAQMITPPRVPKEDVKKMEEEFIKAYKAMRLKVYSRIDGFWDKKEKKLYINEPNTLPGVTPSTHVFHGAAEVGMSPAQFFDEVIKYSLELSE